MAVAAARLNRWLALERRELKTESAAPIAPSDAPLVIRIAPRARARRRRGAHRARAPAGDDDGGGDPAPIGGGGVA